MADRDSIAVVGVDDEDSRRVAEALAAAGRGVVPIAVGRALDYGIYVVDGVIHRSGARGRDRIASLAGIDSLRGTHNWQNAAAAAAAALSFGLDKREIQRGLRSFPGLAHRMQRVGEIDGVAFVNDSKATNAAAAARALAAYDDVYWIAGGQPKAGGIASLKPFFPRIRHAYLIGQAAAEFARTLEGAVPCELSGELATAVRSAYRDASAAGGGRRVVLLSPACASFDQFANFEARGRAFQEAAAELVRRHGGRAA
jgi:UDP-N-acetylmuramoylalanine--D-glutamate ligase